MELAGRQQGCCEAFRALITEEYKCLKKTISQLIFMMRVAVHLDIPLSFSLSHFETHRGERVSHTLEVSGRSSSASQSEQGQRD